MAEVEARRAAIGTVLRSWPLPAYTSEARFKCAIRADRELDVYSITGWVRRIKKHETDGDWHIGLTARKSGDVKQCLIVEIPPAEEHELFDEARQALEGFIPESAIDSRGDVADPVKLNFVGPAFFDGEHRDGRNRRDKTDGAHGRCNASARALWEIHPVLFVVEP